MSNRTIFQYVWFNIKSFFKKKEDKKIEVPCFYNPLNLNSNSIINLTDIDDYKNVNFRLHKSCTYETNINNKRYDYN